MKSAFLAPASSARAVEQLTLTAGSGSVKFAATVNRGILKRHAENNRIWGFRSEQFYLVSIRSMALSYMICLLVSLSVVSCQNYSS
jgi:hypothetical protein